MDSSIKKAKTKFLQKTILQVLPSLFSGGVERGTIEVAQILKNSGYNPIVASSGGPLVYKLEEHDIKHIALNVSSKNPFVIWENVSSLSNIIKEYKINLVHARSRAPAWSAYIATNNMKVPFVTTFHGIYNISNFLKLYYNSVMTKGQRVIAVSDFVKQHMLKYYNVDERIIRVIHRGVDSNYFNPERVNQEEIKKFKEQYNVPKNTPVLLLPARMTTWKGQIQLVKALNKIRDLNFHCLIIGDLSKHPNFTKSVQNLISELKLQRKIRIHGNERNVLNLYAISDIVLSTSIEPEAFGRTIIEGQSMAKLVVATNTGGAVETIKDEVTGYHVKPKNINDLSEKIRHCLSILGTHQAIDISQAARQSVVDNFSLKNMLDKTLDVYKELL